MLNEITNTIHVLEKGGIILYPTDTVWGIGCDATNSAAVDKIFKIKRRKANRSLIILVSDHDMLKEYVKDIPDIAWDLINNLEEPTTIIYPEAKNIARNVAAADKSIAVRIVKDEFCMQLITLFGRPIVSTSANISREPTPLMFSKIPEKIIQEVDYVVKIDQNKIRQLKVSTMIKLNKGGDYTIIRK
ncbi:MAG: L-threonylcarbamoyladenylate synthase [Bacteroidales bacterium]